jgi:cobalamin biosynthesis Co2+ chelatase CbiK
LKFLQDQYNETIEELRKNGIDDVQNIPDMIISLEKEIDDMISNIESQISQIEQKLQSISD